MGYVLAGALSKGGAQGVGFATLGAVGNRVLKGCDWVSVAGSQGQHGCGASDTVANVPHCGKFTVVVLPQSEGANPGT